MTNLRKKITIIILSLIIIVTVLMTLGLLGNNVLNTFTNGWLGGSPAPDQVYQRAFTAAYKGDGEKSCAFLY